MKILSKRKIQQLRAINSSPGFQTMCDMAEKYRRWYREKRKRENRRPKTHLAPTDRLNDEELNKLLVYVCNRADKSRARGEKISRAITNETLVLLLVGSGLRASEALGLRLMDLPCSHGKKEIYVAYGKGGYSRTVGISSFLSEHIKQYVDGFVVKRGPTTQLLRNERGGPLIYNSLYSKIRNIGRKAGLKIKLSPHKYRHTFGTYLAATTDNTFLVQSQLGHQQADTTKIYVRTVEENLRIWK
jgi:integrase